MNDTDLKICLMWESGSDTLDIARAVGVRESAVYNRLLAVRAMRRRERTAEPREASPF